MTVPATFDCGVAGGAFAPVDEVFVVLVGLAVGALGVDPWGPACCSASKSTSERS